MIDRIREFLFEHRSPRQVVVKNALWLTAGEFLSRLVRAFVIIYSARVLGAHGYGAFSYILDLAGFFTIFSSVGISFMLTRDITQQPEKRYEYFATTFFIRLPLLIFSILLLIFAAPLFSRVEGIESLFIFAALLVAFDGFRDLASAIFRSFERMEFEALTAVVTNVVIAGLGIVVLFISPTPYALTFVYILGAGAGALLSIILLRDWFRRIFSHFRKELVRPILSTMFAVLFTSFFGPLMLQIDTIMLGWWRSTADIGRYAAAQRIIFLLILLPDILSITIFPMLSRLVKQGNTAELQRLLERTLTILYSLAFPIIFGGIVVASPLLLFLYGQDFVSSALTFQILLCTLFWIFPRGPVYNVVLAHDKRSVLMASSALGALTNVVFNIILIPLYGGVGSAIATFLSVVVNRGFLWREAKRLQEFRVLRYLPRIGIASLLGSGFLSFILLQFHVHVLLVVAFSALAYILLLILFQDPVIREARGVFRQQRVQ